MPVDKQYAFQTANGPKTLAELFDGRSQLVIYQFMFGPGYPAGCPTNSSIADSFNALLAHLGPAYACSSRPPAAASPAQGTRSTIGRCRVLPSPRHRYRAGSPA